jgi:6-phosphofructokinase 2
MTDIITITLNPAIDKTYIVDELVPDHKLRCANPLTEAGGGGINVSKGLKEMGISSLAVFFSGGRNGKHFEEILQHDQLQFKSIEIDEETRESLIVIDQSSKKEFRIVVEGPVIAFASFTEIMTAVDNIKPTYIIASGSLPKGLPENVYASLAKEAKLKGYKFILDSSGKALAEALSEGVYLMKPNLKELSNLVGVETLSVEKVPQAARQLIKEGKAEVVIVSMSSDGAMLVTNDMHYHVHSPKIERKSTVGAGDSMVSGMVWALQQNKSLLEMVCWGVACGSAATMNTGTKLFKRQDAEMLFNRIAEKVHW